MQRRHFLGSITHRDFSLTVGGPRIAAVDEGYPVPSHLLCCLCQLVWQEVVVRLEEKEQVHSVVCQVLERARKRIAITHVIVERSFTAERLCNLVDVAAELCVCAGRIQDGYCLLV